MTTAVFRLMRPKQWVKNVFVFAGLVFGGKVFDPHSVLLTLAGFVCLCLISSHVYILNDVHDRNEDRLHPRKKNRPIASGVVSVSTALMVALGLLVASLATSFLLDRGFFICVLAYWLLQLGYTWVFKHAVIVDVIAIATGFVLRAVAGAVLVHVLISPWLVICTFTLCLFMGFSKRRCELAAMAGNNAGTHRRTLTEYTTDLTNHMTTLTAGIAVMSFVLYAVDPVTIQKFGTNYLVFTLPLVVYAIFRFAVLVEHGRVDGPTDVLLRDRPFQTSVLAWGFLALVIVYSGRDIQKWLDQRAPQLAGAPPAAAGAQP